MGFCRRCGEIVAGARCKCGGTAVAPVVPFSELNSREQIQDKWSKTYVSRERSISPVRANRTGSTVAPVGSTMIASSPTKRFPRPLPTSSTSTTGLSSRVSNYIASTISQMSRPPSPLKHSSTLADPDADILPSLTSCDSTLTKVYGSVLQPKETLATHSCAICATPFPPDATIYPDPAESSGQRFLCRSCYVENGGSKGLCTACGRPVITLKSEGGFVHAAGQYWHKSCFTCEGCFKNIGESPMVDLLGKPSCIDCFDNCLKRDPSTPKKSWSNSPSPGKTANIGGTRVNSKGARSREASPAIEELEQRLNISKNREGSPALEELSQRLNTIILHSTSDSSPTASISNRSSRGRRDTYADASPGTLRRYERFNSPELETAAANTLFFKHDSSSPNPRRSRAAGSSPPSQDAIEEMKQRFLKGSSSDSRPSTPVDSPSSSTAPLRLSRSSTSLRDSVSSRIPVLKSLYNEPASPRSPSIPPTPDLISDFSDTMTLSSLSSSDSPPRGDGLDVFNVAKVFGRGYGTRYTRGEFLEAVEDIIVEETSSQLGTPTRSPKSVGTAKSTPRLTPSKISISSTTASPLVSAKATSPKPSTPRLDQITIPVRSRSSDIAASSCSKCGGSLFSVQGGKYITIPNQANAPSEVYHTSCFKCAVCGGSFHENSQGQAVYVKANGGPSHVECAPRERIAIHKSPSSPAMRSSYSNTTSSPSRDSSTPPSTQTAHSSKPTTMHTSSSRYERPPLTAPPSGSMSFPRFGSRTSCPGCHRTVSPMEHGVVPGPQGTRWHRSCLVCGGKKESLPGPAWIFNRDREKKVEPGCGKKLDSAAKTDGEGGVWCRECLLLLGVGGSPQPSPTRTPVNASYTRSGGQLASQYTGTTTIARQFTGIGGGDPSLMRQLTGGGISPTRSISPTKQLGMFGGSMRPRPKSVIGMRSMKSVDEGRGMYLVRQMTGSTSGEVGMRT